MSLSNPEEITIKNEPADIPNTETTTQVEKEKPKQKKPYVLRKIPIRKTQEEVNNLRLYARQLSMQNRKKLTLCPKCDKPGHAYYSVRSGNHKLILSYIHSNEPAIGYAKTDLPKHRPDYKMPQYRKCWVGNVLSESDFLNIMSNNKQELEVQPEIQPEQIQQEIKYPISLESFKPRNYVRSPAGHHISQDNKICLRIWASPELVAKIDHKRGILARGNFLVETLEEVLK
jgi:hypothetical protein